MSERREGRWREENALNETTAALIRASLSAAVPLWIDRLRHHSEEYRLDRARAHLDTIASQGDIILYRSGKQGETARAFNALAEAIAALAFCKGGITIFGLHFEAGDAP